MLHWDQLSMEDAPTAAQVAQDRAGSERALALVLLVNAMALGGVLGWIACRWLG